MTALAIHITNPFQIQNDIVSQEVPAKTTIRQQAQAFAGGIEFKMPTICLLNSKPLLRADWGTELDDLDNLVFLTLPQGSSVTEGESGKALRTILLIGVSLASVGLGGPLGGAIFGVKSTLTAAIGGAIILIPGTLLVNALLPPPSDQSANNLNKLAAPSPTYSLQAQGNLSRLEQAIPVSYGRHLTYPDFGATPYSEYINNEQYLNQLLVVGQGEYELSVDDLYIDDTPISAFPDIETHIYGPNDPVTAFPTNVFNAVEVSGQELHPPNGDHYEGDGWEGPYIVEPSGETSSEIRLDFGLPKGLYFYTASTNTFTETTTTIAVQYQLVNNDGVPTSDWIPAYVPRFSDNSQVPLRITRAISVIPGRHQVRVRRTDNEGKGHPSGNRSEGSVVWLAARAYLDNQPNYDGLTTVAMRLKATDSLSSVSSRKISAISKRKIRTWTREGGWTEPMVTDSIAWAMADMLMADYGGNAPADMIDLDTLSELDGIWSGRGDSFNGVFDRRQGIWECLNLTARAGRATPLMNGGVITFVRDQRRDVISGMFTMRNILPGSLSVSYAMPGNELADSIDVEYFDERFWKPRHALVPSTEGSTTTNVSLFGCTNRPQAEREGEYLLNVNKYRRKIIKFQTELDGFIPTYGSDVVISHDMPSWGLSGDIIGREGNVFDTSIELPFEEGKSYVVGLRRRDGTMAGPYTITPHADVTKFVTDVEVTIPIDTDFSRESTHFAFGELENYIVRCKVKSIIPRGEMKVELSCVEENDAVHVEADEITAPEGPAIQKYINAPVENYNLFKECGSPSHPVSVILDVRAPVYSRNPALAALIIRGFHPKSEVVLNHYNRIYAAGGNGGRGGQEDFENGSPGAPGGDAIYTSVKLSINSVLTYNYGYIFGGSGGGGGGGYSTDGGSIDLPGGGGGGGRWNAEPGVGGEGTTNGADGTRGSNSNTDTVRRSAGGAGAVSGTSSGGTGGAAGDWGEAGSDGASGAGVSSLNSGSPGGRAGRAINNVSGEQVVWLSVFDNNKVKGEWQI